MKAVVNYLLAALILGAVAVLFLASSLLDRRLASAERELVTLNLVESARRYAEVSRYLDYATNVPWLLTGTRADIRARRAAIRYWQSDYDSLLADYGDPRSAAVQNNPALQFIVANAAYRALQNAAGQPTAAAGTPPEHPTAAAAARTPPANALDRGSAIGGRGPGNPQGTGAGTRQQALGALDRAIRAHLQLLQNSRGHPDAAFNYEYLIRLRQVIAKGRDWPTDRREEVLGREGVPPPDADMHEIKIYVPVEVDEESEKPTMGEGEPIRKRG